MVNIRKFMAKNRFVSLLAIFPFVFAITFLVAAFLTKWIYGLVAGNSKTTGWSYSMWGFPKKTHPF
jgi:uncharacterized membrane protein (DUF485 family)